MKRDTFEYRAALTAIALANHVAIEGDDGAWYEAMCAVCERIEQEYQETLNSLSMGGKLVLVFGKVVSAIDAGTGNALSKRLQWIQFRAETEMKALNGGEGGEARGSARPSLAAWKNARTQCSILPYPITPQQLLECSEHSVAADPNSESIGIPVSDLLNLQ